MYVEPAVFQRPKDENMRRVQFTVRVFIDPNRVAVVGETDPDISLGTAVTVAETVLTRAFPGVRVEVDHADDCRPDGYEPPKETDWPAIARQIGQTFIELGIVKPAVPPAPDAGQPMLFNDPPSPWNPLKSASPKPTDGA